MGLLLKKEINKNLDKKIVLLCIGSKNIIGDALGPTVGEKLMHMKLKNKIMVQGTLKEPLHYLNIHKKWEQLNTQYENLYTIIVDSSLYIKQYIGRIVLAKNKTILGEALNKNKYQIGNLVIKGIVGEDCKNPQKNIQTLERVSPRVIQEMSQKIALQIEKAID